MSALTSRTLLSQANQTICAMRATEEDLRTQLEATREQVAAQTERLQAIVDKRPQTPHDPIECWLTECPACDGAGWTPQMEPGGIGMDQDENGEPIPIELPPKAYQELCDGCRGTGFVPRAAAEAASQGEGAVKT